MLEYEVECAYASKDKLGESPIWVEEKNSVFWVDIKKCLIQALNLRTNKHDSWEFNEQISCIAHIKNNKFIAGTKTGIQFVDLDKNTLTHIINPEKNFLNNRFNDGKCDNKGRFYVGTMNEVNNEKTGSFYICYSDLSYKKIDGDYVITNGPAFTNNYKKIYFTDTSQGIIYTAEINKDGTIREKKQFISIPASEGKPDGMTVDHQGFLWVAIFGGSCVIKFNREGKVIDRIILPVSCVTSCAFGGEDLNTLFITTASFKLNNKQHIQEPEAGSLFKVDLKSKGNKTNKFVHII